MKEILDLRLNAIILLVKHPRLVHCLHLSARLARYSLHSGLSPVHLRSPHDRPERSEGSEVRWSETRGEDTGDQGTEEDSELWTEDDPGKQKLERDGSYGQLSVRSCLATS